MSNFNSSLYGCDISTSTNEFQIEAYGTERKTHVFWIYQKYAHNRFSCPLLKFYAENLKSNNKDICVQLVDNIINQYSSLELVQDPEPKKMLYILFLKNCEWNYSSSQAF